MCAPLVHGNASAIRVCMCIVCFVLVTQTVEGMNIGASGHIAKEYSCKECALYRRDTYFMDVLRSLEYIYCIPDLSTVRCFSTIFLMRA